MLGKLLGLSEWPDRPLLQYDQIHEQWGPLVLEDLVRMGWLVEVEPAEALMLSECPHGCIVEPDWVVMPQTGKRVGLHFCPEAECEVHTIDPERMRQWEISFPAIARYVQKTLGITTEPEVLVSGRIWWLGGVTKWGAYRELFLVRGMRWEDARTVVGQAKRLRASPAPAILAMARLPAMELWTELGLRPAVRALAEAMQPQANQVVLHLSPLFMQPAGPQAEPQGQCEGWLTVQQAALEYVNDVDGLDLAKAKARVSSAASRGKFTTNGDTGNRRRIDPATFAAWRLAERDRNLAKGWD